MKIAEVSQKLSISTDTLRYYEKLGVIPKIPRDKNGVRNYNELSIKWINFVKCLKKSGFTIEMIKEYIKLHQMGEFTKDERKKILIKQKEEVMKKISELTEIVSYLNQKIEKYNN